MTMPPAASGSGSAPLRHAISLLVHERPEVIVDQCRNFELFAPEARIMIHVSPSADFAKDALAAELAAAGCLRTAINPVSVPTAWGRIIAAHCANIDALAAHCDAATTVSLHASNDMLLARLPAMGGAAHALYETREVSAGARWDMGRTWSASPRLAPTLRALGCTRAVASQVEGSSYPYAMLVALVERLRRAPDVLDDPLPIAEEVIFPSFAAHHLGPPAAQPYILFRKSALVGAAASAVPRPLRSGLVGRAVLSVANRVSSKYRAPDASAADIAALIARRPVARDPWGFGAHPAAPAGYHGIKRIERHLDDPRRRQIRAHTDAVRATAS